MEAAEIEVMYDVKSWVLPHIDTPHGHTNPQKFLFCCGEDGKAEMKYRNWSSGQWLPQPTQSPIVLLKVGLEKWKYECVWKYDCVCRE